jgi:hypothetical protein
VSAAEESVRALQAGTEPALWEQPDPNWSAG